MAKEPIKKRLKTKREMSKTLDELTSQVKEISSIGADVKILSSSISDLTDMIKKLNKTNSRIVNDNERRKNNKFNKEQYGKQKSELENYIKIISKNQEKFFNKFESEESKIKNEIEQATYFTNLADKQLEQGNLISGLIYNFLGRNEEKALDDKKKELQTKLDIIKQKELESSNQQLSPSANITTEVVNPSVNEQKIPEPPPIVSDKTHEDNSPEKFKNSSATKTLKEQNLILTRILDSLNLQNSLAKDLQYEINDRETKQNISIIGDINLSDDTLNKFKIIFQDAFKQISDNISQSSGGASDILTTLSDFGSSIPAPAGGGGSVTKAPGRFGKVIQGAKNFGGKIFRSRIGKAIGIGGAIAAGVAGISSLMSNKSEESIDTSAESIDKNESEQITIANEPYIKGQNLSDNQMKAIGLAKKLSPDNLNNYPDYVIKQYESQLSTPTDTNKPSTQEINTTDIVGSAAELIPMKVNNKVATTAGKEVAEVGAKTLGKGVLGKGAGFLGKKIPGIGLAIAAGLAANRISEGDYLGAGLEALSGAASTIPVVGTAASVGIDALSMARDTGLLGDKTFKNIGLSALGPVGMAMGTLSDLGSTIFGGNKKQDSGENILDMKGSAGTNLNVGNLRQGAAKDKFIGTTGTDAQGFNQFENEKFGIRAIFRDINTKIGAGTNTPKDIISKYAPSSDNNNQEAYLQTIQQMTGLKPNDVIQPGDEEKIRNLVAAIAKQESGADIIGAYGQEGIATIQQSAKSSNESEVRNMLDNISGQKTTLAKSKPNEQPSMFSKVKDFVTNPMTLASAISPVGSIIKSILPNDSPIITASMPRTTVAQTTPQQDTSVGDNIIQNINNIISNTTNGNGSRIPREEIRDPYNPHSRMLEKLYS